MRRARFEPEGDRGLDPGEDTPFEPFRLTDDPPASQGKSGFIDKWGNEVSIHTGPRVTALENGQFLFAAYGEYFIGSAAEADARFNAAQSNHIRDLPGTAEELQAKSGSRSRVDAAGTTVDDKRAHPFPRHREIPPLPGARGVPLDHRRKENYGF